MNLWTDVGLCNGAPGTDIDFIYTKGQQPPCLPICVLVQFDKEYKGLSISSTILNLVPICPFTLISDMLRSHITKGLDRPWGMSCHVMVLIPIY